MPFTCSISSGIGAGFIAFAILQLLAGRRVHPLMLVSSLAFVVYFALGG